MIIFKLCTIYLWIVDENLTVEVYKIELLWNYEQTLNKCKMAVICGWSEFKKVLPHIQLC